MNNGEKKTPKLARLGKALGELLSIQLACKRKVTDKEIAKAAKKHRAGLLELTNKARFINLDYKK